MRGKFNRTICTADSGAIVPYAMVAVYGQGSDSPAVLYSVETGGTPLSNPIEASSLGLVSFFVDAGQYRIVASSAGGAFVSELTHELVVDPDVASGGGGNSAITRLAPTVAGAIDLSDMSVGVWLVDMTANISAITLPENDDTESARSITIVFSQPEAGGFVVSGWPAGLQWEFGLTPVIDTTGFGKTTVQLLLVNGREPLGVS